MRSYVFSQSSRSTSSVPQNVPGSRCWEITINGDAVAVAPSGAIVGRGTCRPLRSSVLCVSYPAPPPKMLRGTVTKLYCINQRYLQGKARAECPDSRTNQAESVRRRLPLLAAELSSDPLSSTDTDAYPSAQYIAEHPRHIAPRPGKHRLGAD